MGENPVVVCLKYVEKMRDKSFGRMSYGCGVRACVRLVRGDLL